jgi:hypothetical protein
MEIFILTIAMHSLQTFKIAVLHNTINTAIFKQDSFEWIYWVFRKMMLDIRVTCLEEPFL